mmetsp:Transcript_43123/g.69475  ORF Transcript_43123/g.69475 Transcript_43123/m.69475 type:complete len:87 (-) Transcript_43123:2622-2882(-)
MTGGGGGGRVSENPDQNCSSTIPMYTYWKITEQHTPNIPAFSWAGVVAITPTPRAVATEPKYCGCAVKTLKGNPVQYATGCPRRTP